MFLKLRPFLFILFTMTLTVAAVSGCSTSSSKEIHLKMSPLEQMPMEVRSAAGTVQAAYQFNTANPDIMKNIPCYCGCGNIGHTSNYDCYVSSVDANGAITFDSHALSCSICVDITQDVMRMLREGKNVQDARAYVDATYSKFGPSNIP